MTTFVVEDRDLSFPVRYVRNTLVPFISSNGDGRIAQTTLDYYRGFATKKSETDEILISEISENGIIKSISTAVIRDSSVLYSITITHNEFRRLGFGTRALEAKLKELRNRGLTVKTIVAEDNIKSMGLCKKVNLIEAEKLTRTRASGEYTAVVFSFGGGNET